jgi:hypothetical protein
MLTSFLKKMRGIEAVQMASIQRLSLATASAATIITVQPTPVTAVSIVEVPYTWTVSLVGDTTAGPISRSRFSNGYFSESDSLSADLIVSLAHTPPKNFARQLDPLPTDVEVFLGGLLSVSQLIRTTNNLTSIATADASVNADGLGMLNIGMGYAPNGSTKFESLKGFLGEGSFDVSGELNVFVACNAGFCNNPPGAPTPRVSNAHLTINAGVVNGESGIIRYEEIPVPEPLTILGSATALGFGAFFKRKLKSSESSEKETINVG